MLLKSHICNVEVNTPEWLRLRMGKFTSSMIFTLMGDNLTTKGATTYIDQKVGEYFTGQSDEDEFDNEWVTWGKIYEPVMLREFKERYNAEFVVTQKMIHAPGTNFSSTPDGLWIHAQSEDGLSYNVSTIEGKCPKKYSPFNSMYRIKAPEALLKYSPKYFWQKIDQMDNAGAVKGYFAVYHPLYPAHCNFHCIEFNKLDLWDYFKKLKTRKQESEKILLQTIKNMEG